MAHRTSIAELKEERSRCAEGLRLLAYQAALIRRQAARVRPASEPTKFELRVAICLTLLNRCDVSAATCFLHKKRGGEHDEYAQSIVRAYLDMTDDDASRVLDEQNPWDSRALKRATVFYREWSVAGWITRQNNDKGFAPTAQEIRDEYLAPGEQDCENSSGRQSVRRWVRRLRKRWGGALRRFPVGDALTDAELAHRVPGHSLLGLSSPSVRRFTSQLAPRFLTPEAGPFLENCAVFRVRF